MYRCKTPSLKNVTNADHTWAPHVCRTKLLFVGLVFLSFVSKAQCYGFTCCNKRRRSGSLQPCASSSSSSEGCVKKVQMWLAVKIRQLVDWLDLLSIANSEWLLPNLNDHKRWHKTAWYLNASATTNLALTNVSKRGTWNSKLFGCKPLRLDSLEWG